MELLLHEIVHFLLTLLAASIIFLVLFFQKKRIRKFFLVVLLGVLMGGFFIDADHLFEYFLAFGLQFRPDYFFRGYMFYVLQKTFVLLHAWEYLIVLGFIIRFVKSYYIKYFLLAVCFGLFSHLIYDAYYNHVTLQGYSLLFRIFHDFDSRAISSIFH